MKEEPGAYFGAVAKYLRELSRLMGETEGMTLKEAVAALGETEERQTFQAACDVAGARAVSLEREGPECPACEEEATTMHLDELTRLMREGLTMKEAVETLRDGTIGGEEKARAVEALQAAARHVPSVDWPIIRLSRHAGYCEMHDSEVAPPCVMFVAETSGPTKTSGRVATVVGVCFSCIDKAAALIKAYREQTGKI